MKIALIKPPATYANWYRRPVIGLSTLGALLEAKGYDCEIFDAYYHSWDDLELYRRVRQYQPDVIGISAMTHEIARSATIATTLKKVLNVPVIIGGCHVTALPEQTLREFPVFDYGVFGEGETTLLELLSSMGDPAGVRGVVWRNGGEVVVNAARPMLTAEELDRLPRPAFHHYYGDNPRALAGPKDYYVMLSSRGCPYSCVFCMQMMGRKVRQRSPENILAEMEFAIEHYGAHTFDFADEIFLMDTPATRRTLQGMIDRGWPGRIKWTGLTRANFVNPELIELAKRAGCSVLEMGVESGDPQILKNIEKRITIEQVEEAVRVIKAAKITLGTYFILGHPGETPATMRKTIDLAVRLNTDTIAIGVMVPYPGTRVYDMALRGEHGYRLLSHDWALFDKYGSGALEITGLPLAEMEKWQQRGILYLYLKNLRFVDLVKYFWERRQAIGYLLLRKLRRGDSAPAPAPAPDTLAPEAGVLREMSEVTVQRAAEITLDAPVATAVKDKAEAVAKELVK